MNRWPIKDVAAALTREQPQGLVDLWDQVPPGFSVPPEALRELRRTHQVAIAQGLAVLQQKAIASAGAAIGFRPELFERIADLPFVDVAAETAIAALEGNLDMGTLSSAARGVLVDIIEMVGNSTGAANVLADYASAIGQVVAILWWTVETIVDSERAVAAYEAAAALAALDCAPPAYSAAMDQSLALSAVSVLGKHDWTDLFVPLVRPFDADMGPELGHLGFTCCISTVDHGRVIAPVGSGVGNRIQSALGVGGGQYEDWMPPVYGSDLGFGCLPMCPDLLVHRAIIVPGGGLSHLTYDPAQSLAQLAGVGVTAWRMLWTGGPSAFAVDGGQIASAWAEYLAIMREQIGRNARGFGTHQAPEGRVCDTWDVSGRRAALRWLYSRIGVPGRYADPDGIYTFADSLPVSAWRTFERYQGALLGDHPERVGVKGPPRPVAAYVDARTCHPAWRARIKQAQQEILEHPNAVCKLDLDSIHDPSYRAAVDDRRRQKGAQCFAVFGSDVSPSRVSATAGPSLDPLGEGSPQLPSMPTTQADRSSSGGGAGLLLALVGLIGVALVGGRR